MKEYNWDLFQKEYDSGLSQREISKKHKVSSRTLAEGVQKGLLRSRPRSEAMKIWVQKNPFVATPESRQKNRDSINRRYAEGWMPKAGRCKKITYESETGGRVSVDGSWELAVVTYLDEEGIDWRRNTIRFEYVDDEGKQRFYTPDIWIESWGVYLEVKGYETALDRAKWRQFRQPLIIWKKDQLRELGVIK